MRDTIISMPMDLCAYNPACITLTLENLQDIQSEYTHCQRPSNAETHLVLFFEKPSFNYQRQHGT